jgi:hypothetical protein
MRSRIKQRETETGELDQPGIQNRPGIQDTPGNQNSPGNNHPLGVQEDPGQCPVMSHQRNIRRKLK